MTNVPEPPYGSVEWYARFLRRADRKSGLSEFAAFGVVQSIAGDSELSPEERLRRIQNVVAAVNLLEAEVAVPSPLLASEGLVDESEAVR